MKKVCAFFVLIVFSLIVLVSCPNKPPVTDVDESKISVVADGNFSITGFVDEPINPINLTLNISGALFDEVEIDNDKANVSSFFSTNIDGLEYKIVEPVRGIGSASLKIEISGTPKSEVAKKTNLAITVKNGYIKGISKDFKVSDFSYSEEIVKDNEDLVIPTVTIASSDIVALVNREIQPSTVHLTLKDGTFVSDYISKDPDGLRSWIEPKLSIIDGLEYTFKSLSDDKTALEFTISGIPKNTKNTRFNVLIPKDVLSTNLKDIAPDGNGYSITIADEPSAVYSNNVSLEGNTNEAFERTIKLQLNNAKITSTEDAIDDVSSWFNYNDSDGQEISSLPDNITASASFDKNASVITIKLSGIPIESNRNDVHITVPSNIYDYANDDLDRDFYQKLSLSVDMRGLKFNIKDPDGVSVVENNKKIVALQNQKNNSSDFITLQSESLKFDQSIIGKDITNAFTPSLGFKFTASEISEDGLTLKVLIEDNRNDAQLKSISKNGITVQLDASFFEKVDETKTAFSNGFSYYIVSEPTVKATTTSPSIDFTGVLNMGTTEVLYTIDGTGIKFVNSNGSQLAIGDNVSSWFRNSKGEMFALSGLTYSVKSINDSSSSIILTVKGTPKEETDGDNQEIFIVVPKTYYEYSDETLKGLPKQDLEISGFNPKYNIYNIGASIQNSVTIKGKMGTEIYNKADEAKKTIDVKINLRDVTFNSIKRGTDVRSWFGEKVEKAFAQNDVIVKYDVITGSSEMTISIQGTPNRSTEVPRINDKISITIPKEYLNIANAPNLDVNTTVADVQSMWEIAGSASVVVEGMNAPIAALYKHPETLNNNEFTIRLIDNYFDTTAFDPDDSLNTKHKVRDLIKNLPYYFNVEYTFAYTDETKTKASAIYIKIVPSNNDIEFTWNKEFGLNLWDESFTDQDNIPTFDETSIPEIARNYCITGEPKIKEFSVHGAIIGLVGKDITNFVNSYVTSDGISNTFVLTIKLDNAYFTDDTLNSSLIESWLTNYVPVKGLSLNYLITSSVTEDGMRHATGIIVCPEGVPLEAKRVFSSNDGTRALKINSEYGNFITSTNHYAKPIPSVSLTSSTIATNKSVSPTEVCKDDGIYDMGITLGQVNTKVTYAGATSKLIMWIRSQNDDTKIQLKANSLWKSASPITNGWIFRSNGDKFYTSQFDIVSTGYGSDASNSYKEYTFDLVDKRPEGDSVYIFKKGDLRVMIPRSDLVPSIIDFDEYSVGEDAVSLEIIAIP